MAFRDDIAEITGRDLYGNSIVICRDNYVIINNEPSEIFVERIEKITKTLNYVEVSVIKEGFGVGERADPAKDILSEKYKLDPTSFQAK